MNSPMYSRRGYVSGLFRIFHLSDIPSQEIPLHFHDFRKIVILLRGTHFYDVEGKRYLLEPGDIVLVEAGELHRPVLPADGIGEYERIIIYFSPEFFAEHKEAKLDACFRLRHSGASPVIRGRFLPSELLSRMIPALTESLDDPMANALLERCHLTEFLLHLNHALSNRTPRFREPAARNPAVQTLMKYLNEHLTEEIDIAAAADVVHLDRSYLMHIFKAETGSSILGYVTEKRLFLAQSLLLAGSSPTEACYKSGFTNYTSFYRAYKNRYGTSPRGGIGAESGLIHE